MINSMICSRVKISWHTTPTTTCVSNSTVAKPESGTLRASRRLTSWDSWARSPPGPTTPPRASHQTLLDDIPSRTTSKHLGSCTSTVPAHVATTCSACCHQPHQAVVVPSCLTALLNTANMPTTIVALAHLHLHLGGLGLAFATILSRQAPQQATTLLQQLQAETPLHPSNPSTKLWTNSNATASHPCGQTLFKAAGPQHNWTRNNGSSDEDGNARQR